MAPLKLNPYNINVTLHLLFLALQFTSLIYKIVDNCVDTIAIKTCIIILLKSMKDQRFMYLKQQITNTKKQNTKDHFILPIYNSLHFSFPHSKN